MVSCDYSLVGMWCQFCQTLIWYLYFRDVASGPQQEGLHQQELDAALTHIEELSHEILHLRR